MLAFRGLREIDSALGRADERLAFPLDFDSAARDKRNSPARGHIRIDDVNAAGQRRSDEQFIAGLCEHGPIANAVFGTAKPIRVLRAEPNIGGGVIAMLLGPVVYWISKQWNLLSSSER